MVQSTCVKCGNTRFEVRENLLARQGIKVQFVQCIRCGTPVSVLDHYVPSAALKANAELLEEMDDYFRQDDQFVTSITSMLAR
ncbi:hypothetical protein FGKAn22_03860 [Ferrigenium kumadai]|uniref:Uncharacterized protein n=2 Tax=Ferrigenium kumadai TaxID=1682490 RepID=A0AAN1SXG6_9PROT|nr:hypothetical protein FGKAn22_03860 [Ferrigenium kumadai]